MVEGSEKTSSRFNPIQDEEGPSLTSFSYVTFTNVGISPQNFLAFIFKPFATLV